MHSTSILQYRGFSTAGCLTVAQPPCGWGSDPVSGSVSQPRAGNAGQPRERVSRQRDGCDTVSDQVTKILSTLFGYSLHSCGGYRCPGATFSAAQSSFGSTCRASAVGPPHPQCYCPLTPNAAPPTLVPGLCSSHGTPQDTRGGWTVSVTWQHLWALPRCAPGYTGISHTGQYRDV